jgi:hypothetical protein
MPLNILLVNPPIYDFTAYDFWMKPYGLLNVAGRIDSSKLFFFDFLGDEEKKTGKDFGLGKFVRSRVKTPEALADVPRPYNRFGAPRGKFVEFLKINGPFDVVLVGCGMTYWYLGVKEVIEDIRRMCTKTGIILGGIYPTLCPKHAASLDVDLVVRGSDLSPLEKHLPLKKNNCLPRWDLYPSFKSGVMKISSGCPYSCTYCASRKIDGGFEIKPLDEALSEYYSLIKAGAEDIAFYDDALLYNYENNLSPFLDKTAEQGKAPRFHTPNGLHLKYLTADVSQKLVDSNFKTFILSLETADKEWHEKTDRKADTTLFETALDNLLSAGAERENISAYLLMGHPKISPEMVKEALSFLEAKKVRPRLAEFSPIPETKDGDSCVVWTDLNEPLNHNKMGWTIRFYGDSKYQKIKETANRISKKLRA